MAEGVLGLGQGQASTLNQELIDKLKAAERKSTVEPIEQSLEDITTESESLTAITAKANELLETIRPFDLFITGNVNAFEEKSATTSGESAVYDAVDVTKLNVGTINVNITALAKNDVFQSDAVTGTVKDTDIDAGDLEITINGELHTFDTNGKTYDELVTDINYTTGVSASMEQVGDDSYRLVIKSAETGTSNAISFSGDAGSAAVALGYRIEDSGNPGTYIENATNHTQTASNMNATVNGVAYDVSSNSITVDGGLKINAVELGTSSITIEKSTSDISTKLKAMVEKYNELVDLVDSELLNAESKVEDKAALRSMMAEMKNIMFSNTGTSDDKNVFNYGFEVNSESGHIYINDEVLNEAIANDLDGLKELFIGVAEKEGIGTQLKTYVDGLDGFNGVLNSAVENMNTRKTSLEEEKDKAQEQLDNKYAQMAEEFAAYGVIINQMEASFSGLKLLIDQSTSG